MFLADTLELGKPRRTKEGYLAVRAKAARAGVYDYLGREVDPTSEHFAADQVVKVYRPESEVFAKPSVHSFLLKPITDDHPHEAVTADNWKKYAKGVNAGAMRDGEHLAFDLVIMDAAAIRAIDEGKKELSNGYACNLDIGDGVAPDGTAYQVTQRGIAGNHIALVAKGRAGPECSIGDAAPCDSIGVDLIAQLLTDERTYSDGSPAHKTEPTNTGDIKMPHTLIIDGLQVPNVSDEAKAAIEKLQGQARVADEARAKAEGDVAKLTTDKSTLEAKVTTLEQQVKDAKLTPQQLRDAAKAFAQTLDTAKKLAPTATFTDAMDEPAIKRAVVSAKLGDAAKDWNDEQVAVSFDTLAAQAPTSNVDPVRNALAGGVQTVGDARAEYNKARDAARKNLSDAWKGAPAKAA